MKLSLYVHDFHLEVGHSRAMIELLNGLLPDQKAKISSIEVVAYSSSPLEKLFPDFNCPKKIISVPFSGMKPFLMKAIFYNFITFFHTYLFALNRKKIGIGIACWNVDIVNVQFIHKQWEDLYFENSEMNLLKRLYKKALFSFFSFGEKIVYRKKTSQFIAIAQFIKQGLIDNFSTPSDSIFLIPSGVNPNEFNFSDKKEDELVNYLKGQYPTLNSLDTTKPIVLFIGAYERKGLDRALESLQDHQNYQFIIIGKPEQSSGMNFKPNPNHFFITFTKEVNLFYELADTFIFPTRYEPFGLVIIEAYAMGLDIIVPKENVGAAEIIPTSDGIYFISQKNKLVIPKLEKISIAKKRQRRIERLIHIEKFSWINAGKKFQSMLFKN